MERKIRGEKNERPNINSFDSPKKHKANLILWLKEDLVPDKELNLRCGRDARLQEQVVRVVKKVS